VIVSAECTRNGVGLVPPRTHRRSFPDYLAVSAEGDPVSEKLHIGKGGEEMEEREGKEGERDTILYHHFFSHFLP